jgi:hypothetical protein
LQILENFERYWDTSIYQYLYQYCRYWKILVKYWLYQYCRYWKILENTGYTSIADTGRFWEILVIPVSRPAASYYPNILTEPLYRG